MGLYFRRKVQTSGTGVGVPVYTGGRPAHVAYIPAAKRGSSEASRRSLGRREEAMQEVESIIYGARAVDHQAQHAFHVSQLNQEEREALLLNVSFQVPAADTVSMALHLRLSNEQQRKLRRWMQLWNVQLASERVTRQAKKDLIGDVTLASEMVQAVSYGADGECQLAPAVYCRVTNLLTLVVQHLDHLANTDQLTWHTTPCGTSLPKDEIWLKVGGDKGGGSFKFCFQVVNHKSPNSADHTVVLALLEADDSLQNMHICIDPFADELEELQGMKWR